VTAAQIEVAAFLTSVLESDEIVDLREIGSEGCVLRTIVPGPYRGQGSWLIARDGSAVSWDGQLVTLSDAKGG
jgi:hypothetical protein